MKLLKCHCGAVEAEINVSENLKKFCAAIAHYAKERAVMSLVKMKILN